MPGEPDPMRPRMRRRKRTRRVVARRLARGQRRRRTERRAAGQGRAPRAGRASDKGSLAIVAETVNRVQYDALALGARPTMLAVAERQRGVRLQTRRSRNDGGQATVWDYPPRPLGGALVPATSDGNYLIGEAHDGGVGYCVR